jgi:flagellar FliJ protein
VTSPGFRFRLRRVHELRHRAEDQAREAYAASLEHRVAGESLLRDVLARRDDARAVTRVRTTDHAVSGADLVAAHAWLQHLEQQREAAEIDVHRREAEADARRVVLTRAARDRQALDRLEERARERHAAEAARVEAAMLDELAVMAHHRAERAR